MTLHWLTQAPRIIRGVNWGMPWVQGTLAPDAARQLGGAAVQSRITALWPDGSVKWTAHSTVAGPNTPLPQLQTTAKAAQPLLAEDRYDGIYIDTGVMTGYFQRHGEGQHLLEWLRIGERPYVQDLRLSVLVDKVQYYARLDDVVIEHNGPVAATVKVTAHIQAGDQRLLDYELRLRFYRGVAQVEIIHTVIIVAPLSYTGLALSYQTPLQGPAWNRQFKVAGDDGVYAEPAQLLMSRRYRFNNTAYATQARGEIVTELDPEMLKNGRENAVWQAFSITQGDFDHYDLAKATDDAHSWLHIGHGHRALGTIYAGGVAGGVALSSEYFWQKTPSKLAVADLCEQQTTMTAYLWADSATPMDFRHYDAHEHSGAYEGMQEVRATAVGIANTSRLWVTLYEAPATNDQLWALAQENNAPAQLVMAPTDYHDTQVLGTWSLPDHSTPVKAHLESHLAKLKQFYLREVEQQGWYGYWNYGDVMHTYDNYRHVWCYDFGGYAWQNTELMVNIWLWQDFLRTGDPAGFAFASAMTRHTSEVDQYHAGEYAGLGSRHNVEHWGDSCKEVRISEAGLHRYYYYLTGDERVGEILSAVKDVETRAFAELAPLRIYYAKAAQHNPFLIRIGPDWVALTSNWFTQWERTGDPEYLRRIQTGFKCIQGFKLHLAAGPIVRFDTETKTLQEDAEHSGGGYHMEIAFGAPQFWMEYIQNFGGESLAQMVAEFGRFYAWSDEEKRAHSDGYITAQRTGWPMFATGLMAYAGKFYNDPKLKRRAWQQLLLPLESDMPVDLDATQTQVTTWKTTTMQPWVSTNMVSQWCLNVILVLALIGDDLPASIDWNQYQDQAVTSLAKAPQRGTTTKL